MATPAGQPARTHPSDGTVTFLFTDIEGSSRLWEQHPALMPGVIARHLGDLSRIIASCSGRVFKTMGDQVCAAMPGAHAAARAALDIQRSLIAPDPDLGAPLRTRVALHTGPAEHRGGDYFGRSVNRVARLLSAGHGGQTLVSQATSVLLEHDLPERATLIDLGVHRLRDLQGDERIFQLLHADLPRDFPPLRTLNARATNLPAQLSAFLGRERELRDVVRALGAARLVTLTGPGGVGKTRLAVQAAASMAATFTGGVWLVELAGVQQPADVDGAIAQALSIRESGGAGTLTAAAARIGEQPVLLVLDNCEQVLGAASAAARTLLGACPHLRVLATSRAPLHVPGEQVMPVSPLGLPAGADERSIEASEAVRLLADRARLALPTFTLDQHSAAHLARICRAVDGLPLAIELAAARVAGMDLGTLASRLEQRVGTLGTLDPGAPQRQRTLSASIEWSYRLLSAEQQTLLARLSVFAGGFTLDAAEAVCAGTPTEREQVADWLAALVNCSMVSWHEAEPGEGGAPGRYRMLHPVVEFARERLAQQPCGTPEARRRHREHFTNLAETLEKGLTGPEQARTLMLLARELDNLRGALACALEPDAPDDSALRLAVAMGPFFYQRGLISEGRSWITRALDRRPPTEDRLHARGLNWAGAFAWAQGDRAGARTQYERAIHVWNLLGDPRPLAAAHSNMGNVLQDEGDLDGAMACHEKARYLYEHELKDEYGAACAALNLGVALGHQRRWHDMISVLRQCHAVFEGRDQYRYGVTLRNLAEGLWRTDQLREAEQAVRASLLARESLNDQRGLAATLPLAAAIMHGLGRPDVAAGLLGHAEHLRAVTGHDPTNRPTAGEVLLAVQGTVSASEISTWMSNGRTAATASCILRWSLVVPPGHSQ